MVISVLDFGAKPNSKEVQTKCFQDALDYCFNNGGGEVVVPSGEYLIGSIQVKSNTTFHLLSGAKLTASRNLPDYTVYTDIDPDEFLSECFHPRREYYRNWNRALICIYQSKNVTILGDENSLIDGQNSYNPEGEQNFRGQHLISALQSENLVFKGYTAKDSGNWCHCTQMNKNVLVDGLTILGGHDGLDFFRSDNVVVQNCRIFTGDDCIAGYDNLNVTIRNCVMNTSCNVIRFGGKNVLIENCEVPGPGSYVQRYDMTKEELEKGVNIEPKDFKFRRECMRIFYVYYADLRYKTRFLPSNILVRNCKVTNCHKFFSYTFHDSVKWQKGSPMGEITFDNVSITGVNDSIRAIADPNQPFELTVKNCDINFIDPTVPFLRAANFKNITFENVTTNNNQQPFAIEYGNAGTISVKGGNLKENGEIQSKAYEEFIMPPH